MMFFAASGGDLSAAGIEYKKSEAKLPRTDGSAPRRARPQDTTPEVTADYADVATIDLDSLGLPSNLDVKAVSVSEGEAPDLIIRHGQIRFSTPSDPGVDTRLRLTIALEDKDVKVPVQIESARPTAIADDGDGSGANPPLKVTGLGPNNALLGDALSFSVANAPTLDADISTANVFDARARRVINISRFWSYDAARNSLSISKAKMAELLPTLPATDFAIDVGLASKDGKFAYAWTIAAHKPVATLKGTVVGFGKMPSKNLNGSKLALQGTAGSNPTRRVATVDNGSFVFDDLVEGAYDLVLLDVQFPGYWRRSVSIYPGTTEIAVLFAYATDAEMKKNAGALSLDQPAPVQNGSPPKRDPRRER